MILGSVVGDIITNIVRHEVFGESAVRPQRLGL